MKRGIRICRRCRQDKTADDFAPGSNECLECWRRREQGAHGGPQTSGARIRSAYRLFCLSQR